MKVFGLFLLLFAYVIPFAHAQDKSRGTNAVLEDSINLDGPVLKWEKLVHDFGSVYSKNSYSVVFVFTNTGDEAARITGITSSCGCTLGNYTEGEIQPGEKGRVEAMINPQKAGPFEQYLTVISNTENFVDVLTLKGAVGTTVVRDR